jgi:hypothetical protein
LKLRWRRSVRLGLGEVGEISLIVVACLFYFGVRSLTSGRIDEAEQHSRTLVSLEQDLGIYVEARFQQIILDHDTLRVIANRFYLYGHGPLIAAIAIVLYVRQRDLYLLVRNAFILSGIIGLTVYCFYPVAPPRLTDGLSFVDTVLQEHEARGVLIPGFLTNEYAALPSLHFGLNLLFAGAIWMTSRNTAFRLAAFTIPFATFFAIVSTGNHFVLDAAAGVLVVLTGSALAVTFRNLARNKLCAGGRGTQLATWLLGLERRQPVVRRIPEH